MRATRSGLATSINGILDLLGEVGHYADAGLEDFAKQMLVRLPPLWA